MYKSSDGLSWSSGVTVASDASYGCRNPIVGITATGRIILMYLKYEYPVGGHGRFMRYSDDDGDTWSAEVDTSTIGLTTVENTQDAVGNIIQNPLTSEIFYAVDGEDALCKSFALYRSTMASNGAAWTKVSDIYTTPGASEIYEPSLAYLGSRLFCSIRQQDPDSLIGLVYSDDSGATWSDPIWYPEMSPSASPWNVLIPIPGGLAWITREYREQYGQINIYISRDGFFWFRSRELLRLPASYDAGYLSGVNLLNGRILLIFPVENDPFGNRASTVENELSGLYATPIGHKELFDTIGKKARATILEVASLALSTATVLADCLPVDLENVDTLLLTVEETYAVGAIAGGQVEIFTSADGVNYDTEIVETAKTLAFVADITKRETWAVSIGGFGNRFVKIVYTNLDAGQAITNIKVNATIGG